MDLVVWQVLFLQEFEDDLKDLAAKHSVSSEDIEKTVIGQFQNPFKSDRIEKLLFSGVVTSAIDRLDSSGYPPSIRLQIMGDYRVTAWCFPKQKHAIVTHIFHKSTDPRYKRAVDLHDARLATYVEGLHQFVERKRKG